MPIVRLRIALHDFHFLPLLRSLVKEKYYSFRSQDLSDFRKVFVFLIGPLPRRWMVDILHLYLLKEHWSLERKAQGFF